MRSASYFISRKQYSAGSALQTGLYKGVTARKNILKLVLRFSTNGKLVLCIAMTSSWATYNNKIALLLLFSFLSFSMWCHLKAHFFARALSYQNPNMCAAYTSLLRLLYTTGKKKWVPNFGTQRLAIWQRVGCLLFQASRALALTRI